MSDLTPNSLDVSKLVQSAESTASSEGERESSEFASGESYEKLVQLIKTTVKSSIAEEINLLQVQCDNFVEISKEVAKCCTEASLLVVKKCMKVGDRSELALHAVEGLTSEVKASLVQFHDNKREIHVTSSESQTDSNVVVDNEHISCSSGNVHPQGSEGTKHTVRLADGEQRDTHVLSTGLEVKNSSGDKLLLQDHSLSNTASYPRDDLQASLGPKCLKTANEIGSPKERQSSHEYHVHNNTPRCDELCAERIYALEHECIDLMNEITRYKKMLAPIWDEMVNGVELEMGTGEAVRHEVHFEKPVSLKAPSGNMRLPQGLHNSGDSKVYLQRQEKPSTSVWKGNLPVYDESVSWKCYCFQWESLARSSDWTDRELVENFELSLRGKALSSYFDFFSNVDVKPTFAEIKEKLNEAIDMPESDETIQERFRNLRQYPGETFRQFGQRVCEMAPQAVGRNLANSEGLKVFLNGCNEVEKAKMAQLVLTLGPKNKTQGVKDAVSVMEISCGYDGRQPTIRRVQVARSSDVGENARPNRHGENTKSIGLGPYDKLDNKKPKPRNNPYCCLCGDNHSVMQCTFLREIRDYCGRLDDPRYGTCFLCGETKHWAYNCPRLAELKDIVDRRKTNQCKSADGQTSDPKSSRTETNNGSSENKRIVQQNEQTNVKMVAKLSFCADNGKDDGRVLDIQVEGRPAKAIYDTGADVCMINTKLASSLNLSRRSKETRRMVLKTVCGEELKARLVRDVGISVDGKCLGWDVYVADIPEEFIIGCDIIQHLKLTPPWGKGQKIA